MNKKLLRMSRHEYLSRFAKWLNQVDDAKIDLNLCEIPANADNVAAKKIHFELAEQVYLHLLYQWMNAIREKILYSLESLKAMLATLKCPVCQSKIELAPISSKRGGNNFSCVADNKHYGLFIVHWELPVRIESETVRVYDDKYLYEIDQFHTLTIPNHKATKSNETILFIREVDKERNIVKNGKIEQLQFPQILFDFKNTTEQKILNRVKTILVFQ